MNQKEGIGALAKALEGFDKRHCPSGELHVFQMIKGSGKKTGVPTWKCVRCDKKVKSN